ncbi:MAG: hypothetical protein R2827_09300 [Bdellovibrionales bacterium]
MKFQGFVLILFLLNSACGTVNPKIFKQSVQGKIQPPKIELSELKSAQGENFHWVTLQVMKSRIERGSLDEAGRYLDARVVEQPPVTINDFRIVARGYLELKRL